MREVSAVSVKGLMGFPINLSGIVGILQVNPHSLKVEIELGWNGVSLDYQSFQLTLAWMELGNKKGDRE
jgi:hypothetical protein